MGQTQANQRLEMIKENVDEITDKIKSDGLTVEDRNRSHHILLEYIKELNLILSKSLRASRIRKVEKLVIAALEELANLEGRFKNIEPRLRAKSLQTLLDIEKDTKNISENLKNQHLETGKETISDLRKRISVIEEVDHEVGATKNKVVDFVKSVENKLQELEIEESLKMKEQQHHQGKLDLNRFVGVTDSKCYKKHKEHLLALKEDIIQIPDINDTISERKKYLLFNIENNIAALDGRVKENEDNLKEKMVEAGIYKQTTPNVVYTNKTLVDVVQSYNTFEQLFTANCSLNELQEIVTQLSEVKLKIDQKLKVLESQIQVQEANPFYELVQETESGVRVQEIQGEVEDLWEQIASGNRRDSHLYATHKKKLEDYKTELFALSQISENDRQVCDDISKNIEDVLMHLEKSLIDRRSKTGDVLIDVMSVSNTISELGRSIQMAETLQDYDFIEKELLDNLHYLRKLEIPFARSNVCQLRDYATLQIDSHLSNLRKIKNNVRRLEVTQARNEQMISF